MGDLIDDLIAVIRDLTKTHVSRDEVREAMERHHLMLVSAKPVALGKGKASK